jgi:AcrR family transcriptional regulator
MSSIQNKKAALAPAEPSAVLEALADIDAMMQQLNPAAIQGNDVNWQQRKSVMTRVALLEAAVRCLHQRGYASFTTQAVADEAGISRGAMLHHYASKADLIQSVVDFAMYRRIEMFRDQILKLSEQQRTEEGRGIEAFWTTLQTPEYQALMELNMAARTDAELREVYDERAKAFDAFWQRRTNILFPEWGGVSDEKLLLARDFMTAALEGLALNRRIMSQKARRVAVRELVARITVMIRREAED